MARVKVRNTSNTNIGFSFGFLFRGQSALVEESRLSAGDRRMIASKKLFMEPENVPAPKPEVKQEEVKTDGPKNEGVAERANEVAVEPKVEQPKVESTSTPAPVAPAPTSEPETTSKPKFTEEQLKSKSKAELKELSEGLNADKRSRADMIAKILEAQEK